MANSAPDGPHKLLRRIFDAAVAAAHPRTCLPSFLPVLPAKGKLLVLGAGKAAAAMAVATEQHYRALGQMHRVTGFVTTRHGFALPTQKLEIIQAGHPVPDANSISGAQRALQAAQYLGPDDLLLVLMSGGASALWAAPVAGVSFEAKQALTKALLRSGARIGEINTIRRHLSRIKGGKLAAVAHPAQLLTLAISDVPGDDPATIGSGPTVADPTSLEDARAVLARYKITPPNEITVALSDSANETLKPGAAALAASRYELVAAPKASIAAAANVAKQAGYTVEVLGDALEGEAREVGAQHAHMALSARAAGRRIAILSGGELTVTVTGSGAGGPNQEYALALAIALGGSSGICVLAADTDGIDGGGGEASDPAGAVLVPDTLVRAASLGLDPAKMLADNNSSGFFRPLGDLVRCGPTQTNVNDLRVILIDP